MSTDERAATKQDDGELIVARRPSGASRAIRWRLGIAAACLLIATLIVYVDGDGYTDVSGPPMSILDALYYATVTLSTTGYGDIVPLDPLARFLTVVVITPLRMVFLVVLVGTTIEVLTRRTQYERNVRKWRDKVSDHTVVVGYGVTGRSAVRGLLEQGIPADRVVVITADADNAREASDNGLTAVLGDACRESVLSRAGVRRAARVVIATSDDQSAVLITMLVRRMSQGVKVVCVAKLAANADFLRTSGADAVIVSAEAVGRLLALSITSPTAGGLMEDLLDSRRGLEVAERDVTPAEIGLSPEDMDEQGLLVLAVIRDGTVSRFDGHGVRAFNRGDRLVVIQHARGATGADPSPVQRLEPGEE